MSNKNNLLILWIIFGFVCISAIDSILYFIIYFIFFAKFELGVPYGIMKFSMPIITLALYGLSTFIILKRINQQSNSDGIYLTEFPRKTFFILALIAVTLKPTTNKLYGLYTAYSPRIENIATLDFLHTYSWMTSGILISRWLILIVLIIVFLKKVKSIENET